MPLQLVGDVVIASRYDVVYGNAGKDNSSSSSFVHIWHASRLVHTAHLASAARSCDIQHAATEVLNWSNASKVPCLTIVEKPQEWPFERRHRRCSEMF